MRLIHKLVHKIGSAQIWADMLLKGYSEAPCSSPPPSPPACGVKQLFRKSPSKATPLTPPRSFSEYLLCTAFKNSSVVLLISGSQARSVCTFGAATDMALTFLRYFYLHKTQGKSITAQCLALLLTSLPDVSK